MQDTINVKAFGGGTNSTGLLAGWVIKGLVEAEPTEVAPCLTCSDY